MLSLLLRARWKVKQSTRIDAIPARNYWMRDFTRPAKFDDALMLMPRTWQLSGHDAGYPVDANPNCLRLNGCGDWWWNAERVLQLSKAFVMAGATATVLTLDIGLTPARYKAFGSVKIIALPCLQRRFLIPSLSMRVIENAIAKADVIHLTNHWTVLNVLVAGIAAKFHKPYVVCPAGALPVCWAIPNFEQLFTTQLRASASFMREWMGGNYRCRTIPVFYPMQSIHLASP
jgi:hypothetical protein